MKTLLIALATLSIWNTAARADNPIPGDFDPVVKWECRCGCAALGMSQWIRVWDNVNQIYRYERVGVSLFQYEDIGQIYEISFPTTAQGNCRAANGGVCFGLHKEKYDSTPVRLEGRYYSCHKEVDHRHSR